MCFKLYVPLVDAMIKAHDKIIVRIFTRRKVQLKPQAANRLSLRLVLFGFGRRSLLRPRQELQSSPAI